MASTSTTAWVVNGQIVNNGTSTTSSSASQKTTGGDSLGKDAFLQLLVAQMKYQDPLAASNNSTEYISQLATFSELESMQNLQDLSEQQRMQDLVGKTVVLNLDGNLYTGQVDYLQYESGTAKMSVGGSLYSLDDLYQVIDGDYLTAYTEASNFISKLYKLPSLENLTESDAETVHELEDSYANMTEYGKSFIADEAVALLNSLGPRAEVLSPRTETVDYDQLMVEKLDELIGMVEGVDKDKINDVLDKLLEPQSSSETDTDDEEDAESVSGTGDTTAEEIAGSAGGTDDTTAGESTGSVTDTENDGSEIAGAGSVTDTDNEGSGTDSGENADSTDDE